MFLFYVIFVGGYFGGGGGGASHLSVGGGGGGSSFLGGCIVEESYTVSGSSGNNSRQTLPGGFDDDSYVSGSNIGVGGCGSVNNVPTKPGDGGNGRILITVTIASNSTGSGIMTTVPSAAPFQQACPVGYSLGSNGGCYYFGNIKMSWYDARDYCASRGNGWLVTVNNQQEQDYLYSVTGGPAEDRGESGFWMGINDLAEYNNYTWVHSTSSYTNWNPASPDHFNHDGELEHCASLNYYANMWNDLQCSAAQAYALCEIDSLSSSATGSSSFVSTVSPSTDRRRLVQ